MDTWKKEMINIIMDSDKNIAETIATIIDNSYEDEIVYLDELAEYLVKYDNTNAEELKDSIENEL